MRVLLVGRERKKLEALADGLLGVEPRFATSLEEVDAALDLGAEVVVCGAGLPADVRLAVVERALAHDVTVHLKSRKSGVQGALAFAAQALGVPIRAEQPVVQGLGGAFLYVNDLEGQAAWYAEHFGLELQSWGDSRGVEFPSVDRVPFDRLSSTTLALMKAESELPTVRTGRINLRVSALGPLVTALETAGISVELSSDHSYGRFAWVHDPEGNRVELWEPLQAAAED